MRVTCPVCNGVGERWQPAPGGIGTANLMSPCPACYGTGIQDDEPQIISRARDMGDVARISVLEAELAASRAELAEAVVLLENVGYVPGWLTLRDAFLARQRKEPPRG